MEVAYVFIGFILGNQDLYLMLQRAGFVVVFKEILTMDSGEVKGNIDAELILQAMIDYDRYDQALIVSGDGDFTCLLRYLDQNNKLLGVIAPYEKSLSSLIAKAAVGKIEHLRGLRKQVEYRGSRETIKRTVPKPSIETEMASKKPAQSPAPKGLNDKKPSPIHHGERQQSVRSSSSKKHYGPRNTSQTKKPSRNNISQNKTPERNREGEEIYGGFGG